MRDSETPPFSMEHRGRVITGPDEQSVRALIASVESAEARRAFWPTDTTQAMEQLALSFPSLTRASGVQPWNADALLRWLCGPAPSSGMAHAARFLLGVWNPTTDWVREAESQGIAGSAAAKRFDLLDAMGVWDEAHCAAFTAWVAAPFWP